MGIKGAIPTLVVVSNGKKQEATISQNAPFPLLPERIITFDRSYIDYGVFGAFQKNVFFFL